MSKYGFNLTSTYLALAEIFTSQLAPESAPDPATVFSSIDHAGRYAFANQSVIAQWNLARLAESLLPVFDSNIERAIKLAEECVMSFQDHYEKRWLAMMGRKLGLLTVQQEDAALILDLLHWMKKIRPTTLIHLAP